MGVLGVARSRRRMPLPALPTSHFLPTQRTAYCLLPDFVNDVLGGGVQLSFYRRTIHTYIHAMAILWHYKGCNWTTATYKDKR